MSELTLAQREKLMTDLRTVVADAESLLKMTASEAGETASGLRDRLQERMAEAKHRLLTLQTGATEKVKAAGHATDEYVHEHPWHAVAVGAGVGLLVGLLIGRR